MISINLILYYIGTTFFIITMCKQLYIVLVSPKNDKALMTKILFLIFNVMIVSNTWLLYRGEVSFAIPFFLASSMIGFWTYYLNKTKT